MTDDEGSSSYHDEVAALYGEHARRVEGFLVNRGIPSQDASDLAGECFLALWAAWPRQQEEMINPVAFLYRIARCRVVDWFRSAEHQRTKPVSEPPSASVEDSATAIPVRLDLHEIVKRLPPRLREVIVLRFWSDLSVADTAWALGISEGAVKRYTADAFSKIRSTEVDPREEAS